MAEPLLSVLYDGLCPLCAREVKMLRRKDRQGRLTFVDIASDEFDPAPFGITLADAHAKMHAQRPNGTMLTGMAAFREIYRILGMGWVMAPTGWPILKPLFDLLYAAFAKVRPRLQRRSCDDGRCTIRSH